ncbi:MAG: SMP-30/gluconolactonase/LRE family protein [Candidatus Latescibacteria bacterium]|nr:SMP-30/gluconolactonase/LRE family protein [Candidatus Latescibacterota bacterium]
MPEVERIADMKALVGEGPVWDPKKQILYWVDIQGGRMFRYDPARNLHEQIHDGHNVGGLMVNRQGGLLTFIWDGLVLWNSDEDWVNLRKEYNGDILRFNDVIAASNGSAFGGSYFDDHPGKLFRFDPDGKVEVIAEDVICSNGMGFSPDDRTFYHTDALRRIIYTHDYDPATGRVENRRPFIQLPDDMGFPDGMTVDAEGFLWSAVWGSGCVIRFDPKGKEERRVPLPARQTSSVMFGGPDLTDLYVTSASIEAAPDELDPDKENYRGGSLYRVRGLGVKGREEYESNFAWPKR